jgi:hypothetical protein
MEMEFTSGWMMAGMLVSSVGFGLFVYGRKQLRFPQLMVGITMMVYPGFVASPMLMVAIGAALVGGLWVAVNAGA